MRFNKQILFGAPLLGLYSVSSFSPAFQSVGTNNNIENSKSYLQPATRAFFAPPSNFGNRNDNKHEVIKTNNSKITSLSSTVASSTSASGTDLSSSSASASASSSSSSSSSSQPSPSSLTRPNNSPNPWEVHKFGGASLADASLYKTVGDLLIRESRGRALPSADDSADDPPALSGPIPTMAVVSARAGMTDQLVRVVDSALQDMTQAERELDLALSGQLSILRALASPSIADPIAARMEKDAKDILSVVQSLRMIRSVPPSVMEVVTGFGEIWSAQTLYAYLKEGGVRVAWLDARDVLIVKSEGNAGLGEKGSSSSTGGVVPLWGETERRMQAWWEGEAVREGVHVEDANADANDNDADSHTTAPIVIATGFVATSSEGVPTTLKRSGSDYSATIFAKVTHASRVTMWKNTDGVYTADPRRVPEAFSISSLKYDEAMELAYFGAQVLHPLAMVPCIDSNIPVYVRNIFNPAFEGTVIQGRCASLSEVNKDGKVVNWRSKRGVIPIKGITSVDRVSLLTLEGASVIGGAEVAERFMGSMADAGINVLMVTQASSESSITVVVPEDQGKKALGALRSTFELELSRSNVNAISLTDTPMSIVAIVGEGMAMNSGVSASFMSSLAKANVNIRVIAQGSSERQVAVVVAGEDTSRALRAAHMAFTLSQTTCSVVILGGTGKLGSALIRQLNAQKESLKKNLNLGVCVSAIASRKKMIMGESSGLCLSTSADVDEMLKGERAKDLDMEALTAMLEADVNPHRVVVDCTNDDGIAGFYERWMSSGINVISPGRRAGAGPLSRYDAIREAQRANSAEWQYESSVGAALPILTTLRDLLQTGDEVQRLRGCVSGTMAYVFRTMDEDTPFSEAVRQAMEKDFTENDVREDLSGYDATRKIVVLARELGLNVSMEDVEVESLLPDDIRDKKYEGDTEAMRAAVIEDLKALDGPMLERWREARRDDRELRYKFVIDVATGKCSCKLSAVDSKDTLYRLRNNENLVAFETTRYTTSPLIVKGAAAGPELAAAGIFADLLRLGRAFSTSQT